MKAVKTNSTNFPTKPLPYGWLGVGLLAVVLGGLFWRSFLPGYVHFSNDGPLGQLANAGSLVPEAFGGTWFDFTSIGGSPGAVPLNLSSLLRYVIGTLAFAKFLPPIALFILGLGAWAFFRQLKFSPLAAILGALAAALNVTFFSSACWGVCPQQIAIGMDFFALALVISNDTETPALLRWARLALAGLAVGMNVMEASDIGAIFSVYVAGFIFFKAVADESGSILKNSASGILRVIVVAGFAGFIAAQTALSLVGANIQGVVGTAQDPETKAHQWSFATMWSFPKKETVAIFVPGVFGYRLNSPEGGNYWGLMGCDPQLDPYLDHTKPGPMPGGQLRQTSCGGNYAGVLVTLLAVWAFAQSLRRKDSVFSETQRRHIWFWTAMLLVSLLLAYGRYAPFFQFFYALPYASTIRNPTKFLIVLSWIIVILFAYGVHGLSRRYLETATTGFTSLSAWWAKIRGFDRKWTIGCGISVVISALGWLVYSSEKPALVRYLQTVGFGDEDFANSIAAFSIRQVGIFVVILALAIGLCLLIIAGFFAGKRARVGGVLLGVLLVADLGRVDSQYVIHWDYKQKYEIGSLNPIIDFLRQKPYEHRVAMLPFRAPQGLGLFTDLYSIEWIQQLFPYYNVQSLDVVQQPRVGSDIASFETALAFRGSPETIHLVTRRWELTNTRYLLGPAGFLEVLNTQIDPAQHRFNIVKRFEVVPKPGIAQPTQYSEMTVTPNDNGNYALFEFTGALPRAKLYSNWQINTNDDATLQTLARPNFDASQTILLTAPLPASAGAGTNQNSGTVEYTHYDHNHIILAANAVTPSVLLLNDKFDPRWKVTVDGQPAELRRANYIMRGVYLTPGAHTVEFQFGVSTKMFFVTAAALALAVLLSGYLFVATRRPQNQP